MICDADANSRVYPSGDVWPTRAAPIAPLAPARFYDDGLAERGRWTDKRRECKKPPRQCRGGLFVSCQAFASQSLIMKRCPSLAGLAATYSSKS
jgi:hypothetical protein